MTGPRPTGWAHPGGKCQGCAGCSIQRALAERDTFTRGDMAHMLALAFRSGAQLAYEMAEDVTRWAADPFVVRAAGKAYRERVAAMEAGAERQQLRLNARRVPPPTAGRPLGLDERDGDDVVVDPDVEWPDVAIPGRPGGTR